MNHKRMGWLAAGLLLTFATAAQAQTGPRDADNEARNAYQARCSAFQKQFGAGNFFVRCEPPALPFGKRLAVRSIDVVCNESGPTRNHLATLTGMLDREGLMATHFVPRRLTASGGPKLAVLSEPVYLQTDQPPALSMEWEGDGSLVCIATVFGYLVNR